MTIRVEDEGTIIIGVIVRAETGPAVIDAASGKCGSMKPGNDLPVLGGEGDMRACLRRSALADPEECLRSDAITSEDLAFRVKAFDAERAQDAS